MTLLEILLGIIAFLLAFIAIKITLQFDINTYLKDRRQIKLNQLKNICPHNTAKLEGDRILVTPFFSSPAGTHKWKCSQCGLVVDSQEDVERIMQSYAGDPVQILKDQESFVKMAKKLKLI